MISINIVRKGRKLWLSTLCLYFQYFIFIVIRYMAFGKYNFLNLKYLGIIALLFLFSFDQFLLTHLLISRNHYFYYKICIVLLYCTP